MSGTSKTFRGSFVGTGASLSIRVIGFRPRSVKLWNVTGLVTAEWIEGMADASVAKRVTAGDLTFPTSNGITPLSDGFTIGADADINVAAEVVHYEVTD